MSTNFIFLHGGGQGGWVWDEAIEALNTQAGERIGTVLTLDVPGCGTKQGVKTETMEVADIITNLLADIDASGLEKPVLIGHSQAGTLIPLLVKARPNLFSHIIYVSCLAPAGDQTSLNWRTQMPEANSASINRDAQGSRDFYRKMFCNDMEADEADRFLGKLGSDQWPPSSYQMSGWDYSHLDDLLSTYVICLRDAALLPIWQEIFAERLKANELIRIDAGHQAMNTRPQGVAEVILAISSKL